MEPLVSVIITTYNLGWCIEETLRSVAAQTYPHVEIIVVDDASTDDTAARLEPWLGRVTYIRHATNQGRALHAEGGPARNTGLRVARGEWVAFLDGDDAWAPEKLAAQVEAARQFPAAGLIVADGVLFAHEDGRELRPTLLHDFGSLHWSDMPAGTVQSLDLYPALLEGCVIDTPSQVMVPMRVLREVGPFAACHGDDYEMYLRILRRYDAVIIRQPLVRYRYHATSVSGGLDRQMFRFAQPNVRIWRKHLKECRTGAESQLRQHVRKFIRIVAKQALQRGQAGEREWARGFLRGFLWANLGRPGSLSVARAWLRLASPEWLVRAVRRQPRAA